MANKDYEQLTSKIIEISFGWHDNEFDRTYLRWSDIISLFVLNFPLLLIRWYQWPDKQKTTWLIAILGVNLSIPCEDR